MTRGATKDGDSEEPSVAGTTQDAELESLLRKVAAVDSDAAMPLLPRIGQVIGGKYQIQGWLGRGGMGAVFRATHTVTGKNVALKWMLHPTNDQRARRRFLREARAAGRVSHPNVVDMYDVGEVGDCGYLVMELLHGETLRDRLKRGPLTVGDALAIMLPVMRGVAAMHAVHVIHRDLKPENVFLCEGPDGAPREPKVLDFGVSAILGFDPNGPTVTRDGAMAGTPAYMAPECFQSVSDVDEGADVYSLGVILYEALSGTLPFRADSYPGIVLAVTQHSPKSLAALQPSVPAALSRIVSRALAKRRKDRYPSVQSLLEAIEHISADGARTAWTRTQLVWLATAMIGLFAALSATQLFPRSTRSTRVDAAMQPAEVSPAATSSAPQEPQAHTTKTPYLAGPECKQCLAIHCSQEQTACDADAYCASVLTMARSSSVPLIANREYLATIADGNWRRDHVAELATKLRSRLTGCAREHCVRPCNIGRNLACVGEFDWPASYPERAQLRFRFSASEVAARSFANWSVRACAPGSGCELPMGSARSNRQGFAELDIDFSKFRPNTRRRPEFDGTIIAEGGAEFFPQVMQQSAPYFDRWYIQFYSATRAEMRASHAPRGLQTADDTRGLLQVLPQDCDYWVASGVRMEVWKETAAGYRACTDCTVAYPTANGPDPTAHEFNGTSLWQAEVALPPGEVMILIRDTTTEKPLSLLTRVHILAGHEHSVNMFPASRAQLAALPSLP